MIRLEALDEHDKPLRSRNAQLTYLHILRMAAPSESTPASEEPSTTHRPYIVKVVKREAVIGSHTFRLQEIYGLASSSSSSSASNSYPTPAPADPNDTPATECVLCLSSPREVVLLPCRHLVACRECAVNMVEFGAGGQLTHEVEATAATTTTAAGAENAGANGTENQAAGAAPAGEQARPRRKRKAKGWFCPVCRQPYTALLRITTTPPGKRLSEDSFHAPLPATVPVVPAPPPAAHIAPTTQAAEATNATATASTAPAATTAEEGSTGKLSGLLGSLSLRGKKADAAQPNGSDAV